MTVFALPPRGHFSHNALGILSVNKWTKVAKTLQSEIAEVTVTFSGLQHTQNLSMHKHYERHIGMFF